MASIFRIQPYFYIHVLDKNTNVSRLEVGPQTFIKKDHENVLENAKHMIVVSPMHYCVIENPVIKVENVVQFTELGQAKLEYADSEIRLSQDPFPLYPGEVLIQQPTPLKVVVQNTALRLKAKIDFIDDKKISRKAGDEWLFEGPGTYIPRKEVDDIETIRASVILPNTALLLRANRDFKDRTGAERVTGEEWLIKKTGAYLPSVYEDVLRTVASYVLTEKRALHLKAKKNFVDDFKVNRKTGDEWIITHEMTDVHIPSVYEDVVGVVDITTLNNRQFCVILDPVNEKGIPQLGRKKLVRGEKSFFLMPGEQLEKGIEQIFILSENEGLILRSIEAFHDTVGDVDRKPGDRWMIRGPIEYVPSVEVEVLRKQVAIPMDENEGIYVRNIQTGIVRTVTGETYMLNENEELWAKELPTEVENLLMSSRDPLADRSERIVKSKSYIQGGKGRKKAEIDEPCVGSDVRDKTQVVLYRVPHNAAVQIYDYKAKKSRVCFGPDLVMLAPDEQFTQLSLSGGKPKQQNVNKSLCLLLGPDFCTDIVVVETADHARLSLQLSYNWQFDIDIINMDREQLNVEAVKIFSVPDFIGDMCKAVASRVRGSVASVQFDDFHKNSARIIRCAVFGIDENNKVRKVLKFPQNNLLITNIDIQSVEPVDQRTRDSLQKSVQLAIEITTNSQEATARHEAERLEQEARGKLERQKILDQAEAEKSRKKLLELQAESEAIASTGQAKAEAQSRAEAARIEGEASVEQAKLKAQASAIETESEVTRLRNTREEELFYTRQKYEIEVETKKSQTQIEIKRYERLINAIGSDTLMSIARAGPDLEVKLLQALNLKTTLITDGNQPINLFNTAQGLIGKNLSFLGDGDTKAIGSVDTDE